MYLKYMLTSFHDILIIPIYILVYGYIIKIMDIYIYIYIYIYMYLFLLDLFTTCKILI